MAVVQWRGLGQLEAGRPGVPEGDGAVLVVLVQVGALQLQHAQHAAVRDLAPDRPQALGGAVGVAELVPVSVSIIFDYTVFHFGQSCLVSLVSFVQFHSISVHLFQFLSNFVSSLSNFVQVKFNLVQFLFSCIFT